jgi:hypothetical protein
MPSSGSGIGTPVAPGIGAGSGEIIPLPWTLLSIHRWAKIMGVAPLHFAGAYTPGLSPMVMPVEATCSSIWYRYDWQAHDQVSHYQLAEAIASAENDIATFVGYWPAPVFVLEEEHVYPRPYLVEAYGTGINLRGQLKALKVDYGKITGTGRRKATLVANASVAGGTLVYTDADGDGYEETATIAVPTTVTDPKEIKLYFAGYSGQIEWEVRPVRKITITGGNVEIILDSWLLIKPELYEAFPGSDGLDAIDVSDTSNYEASVDVYQETLDGTLDAAEFYWEPAQTPCPTCSGAGCAACGSTVQGGCVHVRDRSIGLLAPIPASYSESDGQWQAESWDGSREPDRVRFWYQAGERAQEYLRGTSFDPLSNQWARLIAFMAASRLERPPCACGNVIALHAYLSEDLARSSREQSFVTPFAMLENPFGTRRGEIMAWRRLAKLAKGRILNATVV